MGRDTKDWDALTRSRQHEIKRELAAAYSCPECDGELVFAGVEDRTVVIHELWCSIRARFFEISTGKVKVDG